MWHMTHDTWHMTHDTWHIGWSGLVWSGLDPTLSADLTMVYKQPINRATKQSPNLEPIQISFNLSWTGRTLNLEIGNSEDYEAQTCPRVKCGKTSLLSAQSLSVLNPDFTGLIRKSDKCVYTNTTEKGLFWDETQSIPSGRQYWFGTKLDGVSPVDNRPSTD